MKMPINILIHFEETLRLAKILGKNLGIFFIFPTKILLCDVSVKLLDRQS